MVKLGMNGAEGRMGKRIIALAQEKPNEFKIVQAFDLETNVGKEAAPSVKIENLLPYVEGDKKLFCDVLIDFSGPDGAHECINAAHKSQKALVIGSTGLTQDHMEKIHQTSSKIAIVQSFNMSIGVNVVMALLELASKKLPKEFGVEMSESHHVHKKDAPSGTALMLARQIASSRPLDFAALSKAIHVVREAEIIGDHSVTFAGAEETIEIKHHAKSRDIFAQGALTAAKFASGKAAGSYSMRDVLGL